MMTPAQKVIAGGTLLVMLLALALFLPWWMTLLTLFIMLPGFVAIARL
ncbi:hypothetical protein [Halovenus marina]